MAKIKGLITVYSVVEEKRGLKEMLFYERLSRLSSANFFRSRKSTLLMIKR